MSADPTRRPDPDPDWPPEHAALLTQVARLLDAGLPADALARLIGQADAPWLRNARGVCLLRLGRHREAVDTLRPLALDGTGLSTTAAAHPAFLANYAAALSLDGNDDGFDSVFRDIPARAHPAVARIADARRRWRAGLTLWQRARVAAGLGGPRFRPAEPHGHL